MSDELKNRPLPPSNRRDHICSRAVYQVGPRLARKLTRWNISAKTGGASACRSYNRSIDQSLPEYIIGTEADAKALYGPNGYEG
ncbi:hypothetical protein IPG36_02090 [bacterium]|nr:MAG: hypothetical protein IPG36_02090 [bacterium]